MKSIAKRRRLLCTWLTVALLLLGIYSLFVGNFRISLCEFFEYCRLKWSGLAYNRSIEAVLMNIRLVRIVAAMIIGAALAVSGVVYQTVFSNNMVSPDLLGVSSSAACGAAIAIILGMPKEVSFLSSFLFSVGAIVLTGLLSKLLRRKDSLLLAGIIVSGFARSGLGLLKYLADSENGELESIVYWELGSLAKVSWEDIFAVVPFILVIISLLFLTRRRIGCLILGENARLLGIHTAIEKVVAISLASLLVSLVTAMCGVISWVSLIIPIATTELTRSGSISDNLSVTALLGAVFLLLSDNIARAATTSEVPISIMTGAAGLIIFCVAVFSKTGRNSS